MNILTTGKSEIHQKILSTQIQNIEHLRQLPAMKYPVRYIEKECPRDVP